MIKECEVKSLCAKARYAIFFETFFVDSLFYYAVTHWVIQTHVLCRICTVTIKFV